MGEKLPGLTGDTYRVLQVHPTRRCNLRCLHCYSLSGPEQRGELDVEMLRRALSDAREAGYNVAGFSGGEPVLYKPLRALLEHAHASGMVTTVTSNGMLLDKRRLEMLRGPLDLLAISLDGVPASHNRMRASGKAFETMLARLDGVRESGIVFGFIFTLTQHNLHELDWVANFAVEQGARLLQIHPLEIVGRAKKMLGQSRPDNIETAYAYLETQRLRASVGDRLHVQLDLADRRAVQVEPELIFAGPATASWEALPFADLVSPLVIESDGAVVPTQHGFARRYALGNLYDSRLTDLANRWRDEGYESFRELCRRVYDDVTTPTELPFVNWYDVLGRKAEAVGVG